MSASLLPAASSEPAVTIDAVTSDNLPTALAALPGPAAAWVERVGFAAAAGEVAVVPSEKGDGIASVLFGLGKAGGAPSLLPGKLPGSLPAGIYRLGSGFDDLSLAAEIGRAHV